MWLYLIKSHVFKFVVFLGDLDVLQGLGRLVWQQIEVIVMDFWWCVVFWQIELGIHGIDRYVLVRQYGIEYVALIHVLEVDLRWRLRMQSLRALDVRCLAGNQFRNLVHLSPLRLVPLHHEPAAFLAFRLHVILVIAVQQNLVFLLDYCIPHSWSIALVIHTVSSIPRIIIATPSSVISINRITLWALDRGIHTPLFELSIWLREHAAANELNVCEV